MSVQRMPVTVHSLEGLRLAVRLVPDTHLLARLMLWLGIVTTIGANVAHGVGYGLLGALISAWAMVAFIGSVEIAM